MPKATSPDQADEKVLGIVIAGAAARGAYAAGALARLAPKIKTYRRLVVVGTSSGAVNAALLAQSAHKPPGEIAADLTDAWRTIDSSRVFAPVVSPCTMARRVAGAIRSRTITSLVDTAPLHTTARDLYRPDQVASNVVDGYPEAVAVVATLCQQDGTGGRSRVFLHSNAPAPQVPPGGALDYVRTSLEYEHVVASSAIPVIFPPEKIDTRGAAGFYLDGGIRLNAPIKPALDLGATELIIISSHATDYPPPPSAPVDRVPGVLGAGAQSLNAVLGDAMIEDIRNLRRVNRFVKAAGVRAASPSGAPYRRVNFLLVSPGSGELAGLAAAVFRDRYRGRRAIPSPHYLRAPDYHVLGLLQTVLACLRVGGDDRELLSFLLFDTQYMDDQIRLGEAHAAASSWQY
ncbi:patatin-like phospholipase family protein [Frankia sp. CNm7]|uniref:Patatin-like phospholipase family protein n=1 Tax=Frankia nepalensis TaxID=1836974 RepID=A0A937UJU6_9ACTN|nr:patatin-like phospholipase family protein [Frankia nepalensis]MBL7496923.1 patatin-like phospholipase family protein [Frankia nepalensis]MBL7508316.1 patatin-like phospholipase family protein [Frankia nepalensis]MBL7520992.1 patatin-like phospholipase family protein [Frankia nepalensis]MBL7626144.1 patatin-like phospholipase family protein [Frankia nepalensis]